MLTIGLVLAVLMGVSLGMLGGGGSILTVPILVYVLRLPPKEAIATGLAVVGVTSLAGAIIQRRSGSVDLRVTLVFGAISTVGTFFGTRVASALSGRTQLILFAVVMGAAAIFMFRNARKGAPAAGQAPGARAVAWPAVVLAAVAVGMLTGLVGVGGGFLIVPALVVLLALPMKQAVATSLWLISVNSFVGFAGYAGQVEIHWGVLGAVTLAALGGIGLGTWLTRFVSQSQLKQGFSAALVVMAAFILIQNGVMSVSHPFVLAALGGVLIGLSASLLLLFNGRIAGVSGIAGGLFASARGDRGWRLAFVLGLVAGGLALSVMSPGVFGLSPAAAAGGGLLVVAGLLVGFGTRMGNGCTSGHGVCGISRGSPRSLAATMTFMATGAIAVYMLRQWMEGRS